jgi:hypothetical protein
MARVAIRAVLEVVFIVILRLDTVIFLIDPPRMPDHHLDCR